MADIFLHFLNPKDYSGARMDEMLPQAPFRAFAKVPLLQSISLNGGILKLILFQNQVRAGYAIITWDLVTETHEAHNYLSADAAIEDLCLDIDISDQQCGEMILHSMQSAGWDVTGYATDQATPHEQFEDWIRSKVLG